MDEMLNFAKKEAQRDIIKDKGSAQRALEADLEAIHKIDADITSLQQKLEAGEDTVDHILPEIAMLKKKRDALLEDQGRIGRAA